MLELMDFALIKAYVESGKFNRLRSFLSSGTQIYCLSMYTELQALLQSNKGITEQNSGILARFYESFNRVDLSLDIWKNIGESLVSQVWEEACEETVRILKQHADKNRIFKYLGWVMRKNSAIAIKLFPHIGEQVITPDQMLQYFEQADLEDELKRKMKEKYLEVLVLEKNVEEERFHTQLAYSYIDNIFQGIPEKTEFTQLDIKKNRKVYEQYLAFKQYLANPNARYNSSSILEKKLKNSWMIPEIIQLYGREKRHDEALTKLLNLNEYQWAEKYCTEYNDMLLTKLFKKVPPSHPTSTH